MEFFVSLSLTSSVLDFLAGVAFAAELAGRFPFPFSCHYSSMRVELRGPGRLLVSS